MKILYLGLIFVISSILCSFFIGSGLWLSSALASLSVCNLYLFMQNRNLKEKINYVDEKFEIADAELVRVSALVSEHEHKLLNLRVYFGEDFDELKNLNPKIEKTIDLFDNLREMVVEHEVKMSEILSNKADK